jgi:concanavalin A-like lectin/glucanase superfamily protein
MKAWTVICRGLVIAAAMLARPVLADNSCIENGPYTNAVSCLQSGTFVTGTLTPSTINAAVGQVIVPPSASGYSITNGKVLDYVTFDCPDSGPNFYITNKTPYTFGTPYFVPAIPSVFWTPGTYTYTAKVNANGSPCSLLINTIGTVTINITNVDVLLDVDFGNHTNSLKTGYAEIGDSASDFWNGYAKTNVASGSLTGLKTAEGIVSPVGLLVTNLPTLHTNASSDTMYKNYLGTNSATATVTLTNLPAGTWNVYLYSSDGNFTVSVGGTNYGTQTCFDGSPGSTPLAWQQGVQYVAFTNVVVTNGQRLTVTINPGTNGIAMIAGLQLASNYHVPSSSGSTGDSDYDGVSDFHELVDRTNPNDANSVWQIRLGYWLFDNTNTWVGAAGQLPLLATNVVGVSSWDTNAVLIDSTNPAILKYRDVETNGNANINLRNGTVRFWFKPDWSSTNANGVGPQSEGRFIEMGTKGSTSGWWGLVVDPTGTNIYFGTQTNSTATLTTNLTTTINWASNIWHQVVLTYSPTNSSLYVDGQAAGTNGAGVAYYPALNVRTNGFTVGDSVLGTNQARGTFEDLDTFNYPLDAGSIQANYQAAILLDSDGDGLSNILENELGLNPYGVNSSYGLSSTNGLQVFTPLK